MHITKWKKVIKLYDSNSMTSWKRQSLETLKKITGCWRLGEREGWIERIFQHSEIQSVQFSHSVVSDSLQSHELQHARPPCPSPTPWVHPNPCPTSRWCHPAISSCRPLLLLPPIPPSISLFQWVNSSHEVDKVLEFQLQHQSFQWTPRTDLL